ncbi:MAG: hypothetical protein NTV80_01020, partial [Verrucomicrobia bacterium]|nr:hypothetical protein [Verrucomicrobiota bacterium]
SWCSRVLAMYSAFNLVDKIGVSLARIKPSQEGVDDVLWLVVGDLPPAYLVCDDATNFLEALQCYVREMDLWVSAVQSEATLEGVIPVNVPPTAENADLLARRLKFIRENVLHGEWEKS